MDETLEQQWLLTFEALKDSLRGYILLQKEADELKAVIQNRVR